jgi:hypothetical protein
LVLKKRFFQFTFGINDPKNKKEMKQFLEEYYGKEFLIKHYEKLFGYRTKKVRDVDNHNDGKDTAKKGIIIDLLNKLTEQNQKNYKPEQLFDIDISHEQHHRTITVIAQTSIYFLREKENRPLFLKSKGVHGPINDKNRKSYNATVKQLLSLYGIDLFVNKKVRRKGKVVCTYSLSVNKQIMDIVNYKYGHIDKVDAYPTIFKPRKPIEIDNGDL